MISCFYKRILKVLTTSFLSNFKELNKRITYEK